VPATCASDALHRLRSAGLTARQLDCLSLYYFDGLTQAQIGRRLGISQRAVCYHLRSGRGKLAARDLNPSRRQTVDPPTLVSMDIEGLERIPKEAIRGQW